jgi:cAMP-dependent protein kinase regulator
MLKRPDRVEMLRSVPLFAVCKKRELQRIEKAIKVVDYDVDETVVKEGDPGDAFYVIFEGRAIVVRKGRTIAKLKEGNHFGELALLSPAPRNATVVTTKPSKLGVLKAKDFEKVLFEVPTVMPRLMTALAARAREAGMADTTSG